MGRNLASCPGRKLGFGRARGRAACRSHQTPQGRWGAPPPWSACVSTPDAVAAGQTAGCWGSVGAPVATTRPSPACFFQLPGMSCLPWGGAVPWFPRNSPALGPGCAGQSCGCLCVRPCHTHTTRSPLPTSQPSQLASMARGEPRPGAPLVGFSLSPAACSGPWSSLLLLWSLSHQVLAQSTLQGG